MYSLKMLVALFCFFSFITQIPLYGAKKSTFHLIILAETQEKNIKEADKQDILNIVQEVRKIASYTGMNYSPSILYRDKATYDHLLRIITSLTARTNDTIFFYYTGHGYRTADKGANPWPDLFLQDEQPTGVDFSFVVEMLLRKSPRLLIAIADSCNNLIKQNEDDPLITIRKEKVVKTKRGGDQNRKPENYKHLFAYSKGLIMASASLPGDYATVVETGSIYTSTWLKVLDEETRASNTSWNIIMQKAQDRSILEKQYPQWIYLEDISNIDATLRLIGR